MGASVQCPAAPSRIDAKIAGESNRGRHAQSIVPEVVTSAEPWQLEIRAWSAIDPASRSGVVVVTESADLSLGVGLHTHAAPERDPVGDLVRDCSDHGGAPAVSDGTRGNPTGDRDVPAATITLNIAISYFTHYAGTELDLPEAPPLE